jgi:hypothetical protein
MTPKDQELTVKNLVAACKNIERLNGRGYGFIYLASGFIAHYNLEGFKGEYTGATLKRAILANQRFNQWSNFRPGERDYDYYMAKKHIYNAVCLAIGGGQSQFIGV